MEQKKRALATSAYGKQLLEKQFLLDLKSSKEIFLEDWQKRPWYQHFIGRALLY